MYKLPSFSSFYYLVDANDNQEKIPKWINDIAIPKFLYLI